MKVMLTVVEKEEGEEMLTTKDDKPLENKVELCAKKKLFYRRGGAKMVKKL